MSFRSGLLPVVVTLSVLAGCSSSSPAPQFTVGGTVSGLQPSASLVLQNNGQDDLTVGSDGAFTFVKKITSGGAYAVTVLTQPSGATCTVENGSGTATAAVTNVTVTCAGTTFAVGGTLAGLATGASVVLQNNGQDDLTVSSNGAFTFVKKITSGGAYAVTVLTQPSGATCTVQNGSGTATAVVTNVTVTCARTTFAVGGTLTGLATGASVVLQNNGADNLTLSANGKFAFATKLTSASGYAVKVSTQPAGATCTIANASGTIASADVVNVNVTCATQTFTIGGNVTGLAGGASVVLRNNGGDDLTATSAGPFRFSSPVASGSAYAVTVSTQPATQTCTVSSGSGTATGNVTTVAVSCVNTFTVSVTVRGLAPAGTVVLQNNGANDLPVSSNGLSTFGNRLLTNAAYAVTVKTQPAAETCAVTSNGSGTIAGANVNNVLVECLGVAVIQRFDSPTAWGNGGPAGTAWPDGGATMLQHAYFDQTTLVELKGIQWGWQGGFGAGGAPEPTPTAFGGFAGSTKHAGGPFTADGNRYQAVSGDGVLDITGDMLVCAIVKPYFNPGHDGMELPIIAKGFGNASDTVPGGGWVLMQMHESFCFHYEMKDGTSPTPVAHQAMAFTPNYFADGDVTGHSVNPPSDAALTSYLSPLNAGYVVVCGGREGNNTVIAIGSYLDQSVRVMDMTPLGPAPFTFDPGTTFPATIGAYSVAAPPTYPGQTANISHHFPGQILETAVWNVPASRQNIQTRFEQAQGLLSGAVYSRNREGLYNGGSDGGLHGVTRNSPRIDAAKGMLFGLQSWNRVSYWMPGDDFATFPMVFAAGEDLTVRGWNPSVPGVTVQVDNAVKVPGDSGKSAQRLTLPASTRMSIQLDNPVPNPNCLNPPPPPPALSHCSTEVTPARNAYAVWDAAGPIQGQLWIRVPSASSGTLRVRVSNPDPATPTSDHYDIDLSTLTPGTWKRVWLAGTSSNVGPGGLLTTDGTSRNTLFLENNGTSPFSFYVWGIDLTQVGGGGDAAFAAADLGPGSYDFLSSLDSPGRNGAATITEDSRLTLDVLDLANVPSSTAATGYCLSVDARPADNLSWTANMKNRRTAVAWKASDTVWARIYVNGTSDAPNNQLCFEVAGPSSHQICAPVPSGWTPGTPHNVKGCVSPGGLMRLYNGDTDTQLGATVTGVTVPDLDTGRLLVGNSQDTLVASQTPWHGYVSKALVCADSGTLAGCQ